MTVYRRANGEIYDPGLFKRVLWNIEDFFDDLHSYCTGSGDKPVPKIPPVNSSRSVKESPLVDAAHEESLKT